ncbi:pyridoxamine 5'-phosphate oxidase family protein [Anaerocolumna sp. AGMB13025]|uniref:pyridoxamine 5'-phosphate oxidase family protein n=1 Tax=Anaerocolumna sp. AGMB13025 TaxID=3039116 RepID=UPI00241D3481|nr:pyridoxamine 5'-phosphate oxidase family protein [Anaerocolumna sp. AGMB13025]WFR54780.1 pyridoxamine 5'-phosphate oxidase family protein [Anaerocolumna sp. AGMB13025]
MAATEEKIKEYLKMNQTIILTTIDADGIPDIRTLGGYGISDYDIYFATLKESNKVKQLEGNSNVAVFIQHENQFISKFFNVTIYGKACLINNEKEYETGKTLIISRKPSLKIQKDTHYIYKILPEKIKVLDFSEQNLNERVSIFKL